MKHLLMIATGLLLSAALWGVTATAPALSAQQRATSTPTAMPRIPVTLVARPLPAVVPITATPALTLTQIVTLPVRATPTPTPRRTPVARGTPTRTPTGAPAVAPSAEDGGANAGILDFTAQASRLRGQIDLRWRDAGVPFDGAFIVERSANGGVWRYVAGCTQPYTPNATSYRCADSGLTSGATYLYRACIVTYGASCAAVAAVLSEPVRAP
jgi:hypothetical protein